MLYAVVCVYQVSLDVMHALARDCHAMCNDTDMHGAFFHYNAPAMWWRAVAMAWRVHGNTMATPCHGNGMHNAMRRREFVVPLQGLANIFATQCHMIAMTLSIVAGACHHFSATAC